MLNLQKGLETISLKDVDSEAYIQDPIKKQSGSYEATKADIFCNYFTAPCCKKNVWQSLQNRVSFLIKLPE